MSRTIDSRHLVDPGLLALADQMPSFDISNELLPLIRQGFGARVGLEEDPALLAEVESTVLSISGRAGDPDVSVVLHRPRNLAKGSGAILHIHGGGYIAGDAASMAPGHRQMAHGLGCVILSVDYRLAPETRAPGAVEDCYAALAWLFAQAENLGVDTSCIGVMGESAGGGLAAALALLSRERGDYPLRFQHLIYPMLDDRTCTTPEPNPYAGQYIWSAQKNHFGWEALLGVEPGSPHVSPFASPARAEDLSALPPTYIAVGALDLFVDENLIFAHRLIRAGVPTELHVYPGAFHGFHFNPVADVTVKANADSMSALARALK